MTGYNNLPGDDFVVLGSGYTEGFDAGYAKGYADGLDEGSGSPQVARIEAGFTAIYAATNGEYSREDLIVMDALQSGREYAVRLARLENLIRELKTFSREHGWQDMDQVLADLLAWQTIHEEQS